MSRNDFVIGALGFPTAEPEKVGMSSKRLSRIRPTMQRYIDRHLVPGVVTLVARQGCVIHLDAIGFQDVEAKTPMKTDTIFRIASMTKPITSVALMMLYEEGHFLLSDPVSNWISEFSDPIVALPIPPREYTGIPWKLIPASRSITIRHLLTHTAGLQSQYSPLHGITPEEFAKISERQKSDETVGDFIKRFAKVPLKYHPGEAWEYSRATCVIGHLVEIISGMTLNEFFHERIFKPLKMSDTHFYLPIEKLDRFTACYTPDKDNHIKLSDPATAESKFVKEPHCYFMGSGGLVSTIADYFRFDQMLLNGGQLDGEQILGRKTVEMMTRNHVGDLPIWLRGPWTGFGLGFGIVMNTDHKNTLTSLHKGPLLWSEGTYLWGGAYCTLAWVDPVEQLIGILMTQVAPYTHLSIRQDIVNMIYQAIVN
ncbi:MAG: beta-lactamase family protein [Candidatus Bathyarchaeota archaeon]|nr:MAG: beta-lactamase family protein [Candidatus Bathyarchaeota archaeon]